MSTSDGSTRKHSHYHKDVGHLLTMDVYRLCERFEINDPSGATQHAIKKLVCAGQRGSKGLLQDLQEAVDTINRRIEMIYEDEARDALMSAAFGQQNMIDPADVEISEQSDKPGFSELLSDFRRKADAGMQEVIDKALEPYRQSAEDFLATLPCDEPASHIEDESERMQAIGQNGEMAAEVYAAVDGWVSWNGGECPVMDGTLIDTRHRDGELWLGSVCGQYGTRTAPMFWTHTGDKAEVIAYRLHAK